MNITLKNGIFLIFIHTCIFAQLSDINKEEMNGTITISGAWALYPMTVKWAEEFQKIYPDIQIDIGAGGAGKGMADCLSEVVDIGMISRDIYPEEIKKGAWWVSVTKDAVVPTINGLNPMINDIIKKGVKRETLIGIWITGDINKWGQVVDSNMKYRINVYTLGNAMEQLGWHLDYLQNPPCLHLMVNPHHHECADQFLHDLRSTTKEILANPSEIAEGMGAIYGMMTKIPDKTSVRDFALQYLSDLYKIK